MMESRSWLAKITRNAHTQMAHFQRAIRQFDIVAAEKLLDEGLPADLPVFPFPTAMLYCLNKGQGRDENLEMIKLLIDYGADDSQKREDGISAKELLESLERK